MADISQLNFKVILDDGSFRSQVESDINLAKKLNTSLSDALSIKGAVGEAIRTQRDLGKTIEENADKQNKVTDATKKTTDETKKHTDAVKSSNSALTDTHSLMRTISQLTGVAFGVAGVRRFVSELMNVTGQFEVQKMALTSMLQSAEVADDIFNTLRKNALESPYTFQDLTKYAKQLTAFNIDADKLIETEKRLADVAAGLGVDMQRIILAYGQVKAAGVLKGTELRQFTEAGVPLLQSLAEQIQETEGHAISLSEVFARISKKQIPFEMVEEAFRRMTDEGGKFYNMQEVLVNTLQGKISKLRDVWQQSLYDIGMSQEGVLKGSVDFITNIVANLDKLGKLLPDVIAAWGAYRTGVILATAATEGLSAATNIGLLGALKKIALWIASNPWAILAATIAVATVEIVKFYNKSHEAQNRLNSAMKEFDTELRNETEGLDELKIRLEKAEKGTEEWTAAKDEAVRKYGKYFDGLDTEIEKVGTLETAYDNLKTSIEEATRLRQGADFERTEKEIWDSGNKSNLDALSDYVYEHYSRPDAFFIMNEAQKAMRQNLSWRNLVSTRLGGLGLASEGFWDVYEKGSAMTRNKTKQLFSKLLEDDKQFRAEYTKNMREFVKQNGLQGTAIDPDYRGPIVTKDENKPTVNTKPTNTWTPLKDDLKDVKDEYAELAKEIDKDNQVIFDQTLDELEESIKQFDDYYKMMDKWERRDFNLWGETETERKMSKIVSDYATKEAEIEERRKNAIIEAKKAHHGNAEAIAYETKKINDLAKKEKDYERTLAQDKISDLARGYFSEFTGDLDMEALSTKSREELNNLRTKILQAKDEALAAIDDAAVQLRAKGFNVNDLKIKVTREFDNAVGKTDQAQETKNYAQWQRTAKAAAKAAQELADGLVKIGQASGNSKLTNIGEAISGTAKAIEAAASGVKEYGGWWGAIIGTLKVVGRELLEDFAIWKEVEAAMRRSQVESLLEKMDNLLGSSKGTLGESWTKGLRDAVSVMDEMRRSAIDINENLSGQEIKKRYDTHLWGDWDAYQDALIKGYEGAEAYIVKTHDRSGFLNWLGLDDKYSNLKDLVEGLGYALYDENGNLNAKGLQAILDTYTKLSVEDKEWIESAISYSEKYQEAIEKVKDTVSDLFGDISGTLADNMIQAFKETGNAVDDLASAFEDLGETFVKSMLESAIYETVLKDYQKDMETLFTEYGSGRMSYTDLLDRVNGIFDGMSADFEKSADVYNAILNKASDLNWLGDTSSSSDTSGSLGSGIKSITEDTANLLASYINAIRDDVSAIRKIQEAGQDGAEVLGASTPTLNEYLAQIAATNFDIAQSNQSILSELRSVIGAPGTTGMVVRVESY